MTNPLYKASWSNISARWGILNQATDAWVDLPVMTEQEAITRAQTMNERQQVIQASPNFTLNLLNQLRDALKISDFSAAVKNECINNLYTIEEWLKAEARSHYPKLNSVWRIKKEMKKIQVLGYARDPTINTEEDKPQIVYRLTAAGEGDYNNLFFCPLREWDKRFDFIHNP